MMPPTRGRENLDSEVFFTVPIEVAMKTKRSSSNSLTGRIAFIFSPSSSFNKLTIGFPRDPRPPCGTLYTLIQ